MRVSIYLLALLVPMAVQADPSKGEHLAYTVGCVNCHHQTDKHIINAPPLVIIKGYSLPQFRNLMKNGVTSSGRDLVAQHSVMGFVAKEQFAHFSDDEVTALYDYFTHEWTAQKGTEEEKKIPIYFPASQGKGHSSS